MRSIPSAPSSSTALRLSRTAVVILVLCGASLSNPAAQPLEVPRSGGTLYDAHAWRAHFESWVNRQITQPEIAEARSALPRLESSDVLSTLQEMVRARVELPDAGPKFPAELVPAMWARGLKGEALEAARLWGAGQRRKALAALRAPSMLYDPSAAHLRAQMVDQWTRGKDPLDRIGAIGSYRFAISLDPKSPVARRARIRVAQIFLEIGFREEALAALSPYVDAEWPAHQRRLARATVAEAAFSLGRHGEAQKILDALDPAPLPSRARIWWIRRRGDSHFLRNQYAQAAAAYAHAYDAEPRTGADRSGNAGQPFDPVLAQRMIYAHLRSGEIDEARVALGSALSASAGGGHQPDLALLGVLIDLAQQDLSRMIATAEQVMKGHPQSEAARIAALYWIEGRHQRHEPLQVPRFISAWVDLETRDPVVALLSARIESLRQDGDLSALSALGALARRLPHGPARELMHNSLAEQLLRHVAADALDLEPPGPELLDVMERELDPEQLDENALLLAIEGLLRAGRSARCQSWAQVLRRREMRPIRRGLAAWREMQCARLRPADAFTVNRMLVYAESGDLGPFTLAFAALAAEARIARGAAPSGLRLYERALESLAEPQILGPVLLRTGELHNADDRPALALRRLARGLTVTDSPETARDPFRKAGIVVLGQVAERSGKHVRFSALLKRDLSRIDDPWWQAAYRYLGYRIGEAEAPLGGGPFAEGARELVAAERTAQRLRRIIRPPEPEPSRRPSGSSAATPRGTP